MESLNLKTLANSLPAGQQNAEKELLNDFKAAALSITKLYRSSRKTSKRAYNAGYGAACQDLLNFIQQGVSANDVGPAPTGSSHGVDGRGMTIGRVMDWTEARLEAIRATEEEEDEDEEREKDRERPAQPAPTRPSTAATATPASPKQASKKSIHSRAKDIVPPNGTHPSEHSSSSPSPPPSGPSNYSAKPLKTRTVPPQPTPGSSTPFLSEPFPAASATATLPFSSETPIVIGAGTKRRHAVMMMLDSGSSPITGTGPSSATSSPSSQGSPSIGQALGLGRRRTRSSRNLSQLQPQNQNINLLHLTSEAMDVEEDGRERKRAARR